MKNTLVQEHNNIREEIKLYSWKTIRKFLELFPCTPAIHTKAYLLEVYPIEYCQEQDQITQKSAQDQINGIHKYYHEEYTTEYIKCISPEDFWERWNRFKKIIAFI